MALIKSAKELVGDNEIIQSLITKEIIAMLAPADDIPEYENAYIQSLPSGDLKTLMTDNNEQVNSRDLGDSMIPRHEMFGEEEENESDETSDNGDGVADSGDNTSILGGAGTPVTNVGMTYYAQQVPPLLLNTMNTGR
jgi:hypothetical protein